MNESIQIVALLLVTLTAVITDLRHNKIPNVVVLVGLLGGVALHTLTSQSLLGTAQAIGGAILAGLLLLPFYIKGGMAAGDIKLMAAVGAIVGWPNAIPAVLLTLIIGGFLAVVYIILRGGGVEFCKRYIEALRDFVRYRTFYIAPATEGSIARARFPYALAIACGGVAALIFPDLVPR